MENSGGPPRNPCALIRKVAKAHTCSVTTNEACIVGAANASGRLASALFCERQDGTSARAVAATVVDALG